MQNISIIGYGAIGKAIEHSLNPSSVGDIYIWDKKISPTPDRNKISDSKFIFLCVPSNSVRDVLNLIKSDIKDTTKIICLAKGVEKGTSKFMTEVMREFLQENQIAILAGPMLADEIIKNMGGVGIIAAHDKISFKNIFLQDKLKIIYSHDADATTLISVLKNIYTIITGIAVGLGYGKNIQGFLMSESGREWRMIFSILKQRNHDLENIEGLGDFIATATSPLSMNRNTGILIAEGKSFQASEGVNAILELSKRIPSEAINELPIFMTILKCIADRSQSKAIFDNLIKIL